MRHLRSKKKLCFSFDWRPPYKIVSLYCNRAHEKKENIDADSQMHIRFTLELLLPEQSMHLLRALIWSITHHKTHQHLTHKRIAIWINNENETGENNHISFSNMGNVSFHTNLFVVIIMIMLSRWYINWVRQKWDPILPIGYISHLLLEFISFRFGVSTYKWNVLHLDCPIDVNFALSLFCLILRGACRNSEAKIH